MRAQGITHMVFGYGSLICSVSRSKTVPEHADKIVTPVVVRGLERTWNKRTARGMTAMGVRFAKKSECVGVLLPVNDEDLRHFDAREQGYDRVPLRLQDVDMVPFLDQEEHYSEDDHSVFLEAKQKNDTEHVKLWVYVPRNPTTPAPEYPIAQTYLDTILRGCLDISEEFAKEFVTTTKGWSKSEVPDLYSSDPEEESSSDEEHVDVHWVDDRDDPIYPRSDIQHIRKNSHSFDSLLEELRPEHFSNRKSLSTEEADTS